MTNEGFQKAGKAARYILFTLAVVCALWFVNVWIEYDRLWRGGILIRQVVLGTSLVLFCLFAAGMFLRSEQRMLLALVALSAIAGIYIAQGVFYLASSGNARAKIARSQGAEYDARSKARFIEETGRAGESVAPAATPTFWVDPDGIALNGRQVFPLAGLSRRDQVMCNESGRWIKFQSDRYGFNNPDGIWDKPLQTVLIGDSFVHGVCVDRNGDIAGSLRKGGWSTVNLGMTGNGPLLELATLVEYGRKLKPKLVLWFYYEENDMPDLRHETGSPTLMRYLRDESFSQQLISRQAEIDPAIEHFITSSRPTATSAVRKLQWVQSFLRMDFFGGWLFNSSNPLSANRLFSADDYRAELLLFGEILKRARLETENWGGKLVFVYLPRWSRYAYRESDEANLRQQVQAAAEKAGLPVFDFHTSLSAQPDPLAYFPFRIDGHYTPEGHDLLARDLKAWMARNRIGGPR